MNVVRIIEVIAGAIPLALELERDHRGQVQRANLFRVIPIYDRARGERRRARRRERRAQRARDAP